MRRFYESLEGLLKRHQPIDYGPYAALKLRESQEDGVTQLARIPPHYVLHSIEANCRYARGQNSDAVDWPRFARVMNVYHDYPERWPVEVLTNNSLDHFFLLLYRQQMELQYCPSRNDLARIWHLFVNNNDMVSVSQEFEKKYHLSMAQWVKFCLTTYTLTDEHRAGCFSPHLITHNSFFKDESRATEAFFRLSSCSPKEIGRRYEDVRRTLPPQFHFLVRSVFIETPLIDFGENRMLCPMPKLMFRQSGEGLYRLSRELPGFSKAFGKAVQNCVKEILQSYANDRRILEDRELGKVVFGKRCDFLVDLPEGILLVECKGTTFVAHNLTTHAIAKDNSTGKVARGMKQLYVTAADIKSGKFRSIGIDSEKPILGIVVTFGELPLANSCWYFDTFFLKRRNASSYDVGANEDIIMRRPMVLSLATLQDFVRVLISTPAISPFELYDAKEAEPYHVVGDWDAYLRSRLRDCEDHIASLPFEEDQFDDFFAKLRCLDRR
jgi:hypothetical protein